MSLNPWLRKWIYWQHHFFFQESPSNFDDKLGSLRHLFFTPILRWEDILGVQGFGRKPVDIFLHSVEALLLRPGWTWSFPAWIINIKYEQQRWKKSDSLIGKSVYMKSVGGKLDPQENCSQKHSLTQLNILRLWWQVEARVYVNNS